MSKHSIENLENRSYFSTQVPWIVNGTDGYDIIVIRYNTSVAQVYINSGTDHEQYMRYDHPPSNMVLQVNAKGGNDLIRLNDIDFGGSVQINGGDGNDHITIGGWSTYAQSVDGPVTVIGGEGNDDLTIDDSMGNLPQFQPIFTVTNSYVRWGGINTGGAQFSQWKVNYDNSMEFTTLKGSNQKTQYNILSTSSATPISIKAGKNDDQFSIGDGDVDSNIKGNLSIQAGLGNDRLYINDAIDSGRDSYWMDLSRIWKNNSAVINFTQFEKTELDANLETNTFQIDGILNNTTLNGSNGDDIFRVGGGTLKYIRRELTLNGQSGDDKVIIDDSESTTAGLYNVWPGEVRKSNAAVGAIKSSSIASLSLASGSGDDTFNVTPALGTTFTLRAGQQSATGPRDRLAFTAGVSPIKGKVGNFDAYKFFNRNPVIYLGFETLPYLGSSINGSVFFDHNQNGTQDPNDQGLAGRTVYIDLDNDKVLDDNELRTTTNGDGKYLFTGLLAGTYKVRQILSETFIQTSPANGYGLNITVGSSQSVAGKDFGVYSSK